METTILLLCIMKNFLLIAFLLFPLPALAGTEFRIQWQDSNGNWRNFSYQKRHKEAQTFQIMKNRALSTGKAHRMLDDQGNILKVYVP